MADHSQNHRRKKAAQDSDEDSEEWLDPALRATRPAVASQPAQGQPTTAHTWPEGSAQEALQMQRDEQNRHLQRPPNSSQTAQGQNNPVFPPATHTSTPQNGSETAQGQNNNVFPPATHASTGPAPGQPLIDWMFSLPPYDPAVTRAWEEPYAQNVSGSALGAARARSTWARIRIRCATVDEAVHWSDKIEAAAQRA